MHHALGSEAVGVWSFDEGSGTTAYDASGYGNDGTLVNGPVWRCASTDPSYTPAGAGCSLQFDSVDDHVNARNDESLNITQELTISAWINYPGTVEESWGGIVARRLFNVSGYSLRLRNSTRTPFLQTSWLGGNSPEYHWANPITLNKFEHIAITFSVSSGRVITYLNGIIDKNVSITGSIEGGTETFYIGRYGGSFFKGLIDEVRIYEKALETAQIKELYYAGLDRLLVKGLIDEQEYQKRLALKD